MRNESLLLCLLLLIGFCSEAFAKRSPPEPVRAVEYGALELRVPHNQMGCIEAWDVKHKALIWRRQIYVVKYNAELERDVQDVFIAAIELNLNSLEVKVIKGALVEKH
jgi:hypothetical protein